MAVEFMVIAAPRSGTTWAANWLTTDTTLCLHDVVGEYRVEDLDLIKTKKTLGISCTGIAVHKDWLNCHPARKVILHRDAKEVNQSLVDFGFPETETGEIFEPLLNGIAGHHCHWTDLFENPQFIYEFLTGKEFDQERHAELKKMLINPDLDRICFNKDAVDRYFERMRG